MIADENKVENRITSQEGKISRAVKELRISVSVLEQHISVLENKLESICRPVAILKAVDDAAEASEGISPLSCELYELDGTLARLVRRVDVLTNHLDI